MKPMSVYCSENLGADVMQQGENKAVTGLKRFPQCCGVGDKFKYLMNLVQSFIPLFLTQT